MIASITRYSRFTQLLCGAIGLYMLNISVDPTDQHPLDVVENLSINKQESLIEIFVEKILGYEDAIEERDERDKEDHSQDNSKIKFLKPSVAEQDDSLDRRLLANKQKFLAYSPTLTEGFHRLDPPPPKN